MSISTDQSRDVFDQQRDEICNLTLPPARELRDYHKDLWIKFGKEETATVRRIESVQDKLKQQQDALGDLEKNQVCGAPAQPTRIEKIKYLTREIQTNLRKVNAWNSGQLEGLERTQNSLEEELEVIEKSLAKTKIEEVSAEIEEQKIIDSKAASVKNDNKDVDEVKDENLFEDFHDWIIRTGGHNGGWTPDDHLHMVTLTHRHANWRKLPERFLEEVWSGVRAVSSREGVRRHVEWWVEYCSRRDKQKERIGQWRKRKMMVKEEERKSSATTVKPKKLRSSAWMKQNEEKLRKLEEWKKLKAVKKEIAEAEELLRVAEKKAKIEQRMQRRNQQIKKYLKIREEKKRLQQEKEEEEKRMNEMERKQKREMNRMVLSQYHEKDMERIHWKIKMKADEQVIDFME